MGAVAGDLPLRASGGAPMRFERNAILVAALAAACGGLAGNDVTERRDAVSGAEVSAAVAHAVSPPLRDIPSAPRARRLTEKPLRTHPAAPRQPQPDPV